MSRVRFCVFEAGGDILKKIVDLTKSFNMPTSKEKTKKVAAKDKISIVSTEKEIRRQPRKRKSRGKKTLDDTTIPNTEESELGTVNDASAESKSPNKTPIGDNNKSDDSSKCASKSGENDSDKKGSAKRTKGIVDANDAGSQSIVLSNKTSDDQENEEKENSDNASSHDESASVKTQREIRGKCCSKRRQRLSQLR